MNRVTLMGRLGADPEIRRTRNGDPIANMNIATEESWRDRQTGERVTRTEWHRVVIFAEGPCKVAENYLRKGARVLITGQMQTRKWQDRDGQDRFTTEVVLKPFKGDLEIIDWSDRDQGGRSSGRRADPRDQQRAYDRSLQSDEAAVSEELDDDIPF